jgi:hypothetical protein
MFSIMRRQQMGIKGNVLSYTTTYTNAYNTQQHMPNRHPLVNTLAQPPSLHHPPPRFLPPHLRLCLGPQFLLFIFQTLLTIFILLIALLDSVLPTFKLLQRLIPRVPVVRSRTSPKTGRWSGPVVGPVHGLENLGTGPILRSAVLVVGDRS